jgi:aryl-alcohol dehydrogenase-like predicted oxidoreductase
MSQTMGKIGNRTLPRVGLGCMGMSEFYGAADDAASLRLLHRARELGYVHFDTADMYGMGHNEQLLGRFLADVPREAVFIASKFGIVRDETGGLSRRLDGHPDYVKRACEKSLQRLGTTYLDLYYVHRRDTSVPIEETVGAMAELVRAGKVREIGLSEVSADTLRRAHAVHPVAATQTEYSLLSRTPEAELFPTCRELGIAFVAYSPLSRGLLGELSEQELRAPGDVRQFLPRFSGDNFARNRQLLGTLERLAREKQVKVSQLALAWVLGQDQLLHVIPGTRRERYLNDNFEAGQLRLTAAELSAISAAIDPTLVAGNRYPDGAMQGIGA